MDGDLVEVERAGHVLVITLNRPKVNAIDRALSRAIYAAGRQLQDDPELRVGLITAKGERVFSAGWDFREVMQRAAAGSNPLDEDAEFTHGPGGFAGLTQFWDLTKPIVAAVNGAAVGGGFELALATDVIVMAENAYFELPEMQRGFLPDAGGVQRLPRCIPYNVAMEMILTGRRMPAAEALRWGLVHKVVPVHALHAEARAVAEAIARGAPLALQALKEVMRAIDSMPIQAAMTATRPGQAGLPIYRRMAASEDALEGPRAFLEKRSPIWRGR